MNHTTLRSVLIVTGCLLAGTAHASLLVNGGFEAPVQGVDQAGDFLNFSAGNEPQGFGWKVGTGDIDLGWFPVSPFIEFAANEGNQAIDLNGNRNGEVFQDFATVAGQRYALRFAYADNPREGGDSTADVTVSNLVNGNVSGSPLLLESIVHSTSSNGPPAIGDWTSFTRSFVAGGASTRLRFTSTSTSDSPSGGVLLDSVSVERADVPAPVGAGLAAAVVMLLAGRFRRRVGAA